MMDILAEFQAAQAVEQEKRQRKQHAVDTAQVDKANLAAIQLILDVREALLGIIINDAGYPVAKAFYTVEERPTALFCFLNEGPNFDAASYVTPEGEIVSRVNIFQAGQAARSDAPEGAASYFIQWIAEHEQVANSK